MHISIGGHGNLELPDSVVDNIRIAHSAGVDSWLAGLGPMLSDVLSSLDARLVPGNPPLSYHLVFFAEQASGDEIVIKCTIPNREQRAEVAGVDALSDAGIGPQLRWADLDKGVLAMERVQPGTIMSTTMPSLAGDARITRELSSLAARMARNVDIDGGRDGLISVRHYSRALDELDESSSLWSGHRDDVQQALELRNGLLAASVERSDNVFLHGDLHHYNVLRDNTLGWSVIDPKGLHGPAGYDFGALTYNPIGIQRHPQLTSITRQRVEIWSEITSLPWETVRSWGFVAAMLSACWSAQEGGDNWQGTVAIASILRDLSPVR